MFGMRRRTLKQIALLGAIAGMRSMSAPAFATTYLRQRKPETEAFPFRWLATPVASTLFKLLAAGELAADKLPEMPARIEPGPLLGRAASGALCGATVSHVEDEPEAAGALLGAATAVVSAFAAYYLRKELVKTLALPDPLIALFEDTTVLGGGLQLLSEKSPASTAE